MKSSDPPVVVEHTFNTSIQKVWSAITELDEMKHLLFAPTSHLFDERNQFFPILDK